jgi:predicted nucleic acid-binding protein
MTSKTFDVFVLDGSVAVAWFFEDEANTYAESIEDSLEWARAVPSLWPLEVANALLMGERRRRTTEAKVTQYVRLLQALPVEVEEQDFARAFEGVLSPARIYGLSAYDAAYLEVAMRRELPLATLDRRLREAAAAAGVARYAP